MPSSSNNIWFDSTFTNGIDTDEYVRVDYYTTAPDGIGNFNMPSVVVYPIPEHRIINIDINTFIEDSYDYDSIVDLYNYIDIHTTVSGIVDCEISINLFDVLYGRGIDVINSYFVNNYQTLSFIDICGSATIGNRYSIANDIYTYNYIPTSNITNITIDNLYTNFTGSIGVSGIAIPSYYGVSDIHNYIFRSDGSVTNSIESMHVDSFFAGWVDYTFLSCIISSDCVSYMDYMRTYLTAIYGNVNCTESYVCCAVSGRSHVPSTVHSTVQSCIATQSQYQTITGRFTSNELYVSSCNVNASRLLLEVNLLSIKVSDVSLPVGSYIELGKYLYFEVTDDVYGVDSNSCFMVINDNIVSTTSEVITNGYRFLYNVNSNDFEEGSHSKVTMTGVSNSGVTIDRSVYLTFAYVVAFNNVKELPTAIDYGFENEVVVRVEVHNEASCPTYTSDSWVFKSSAMVNRSLSANINGRLYSMDFLPINAEIIPNSTAYLYNKSMTITVDAKDLLGNRMATYKIDYRIEDKP